MLRQPAVIREAASAINEAASAVAGAYADGAIQQEPAFTDRLLGQIEARLASVPIRGTLWRAKTFTDRGPGAQESVYGADLAGVFSAALPDYCVRKGFLAQAKRLEPGQELSRSESLRCFNQCDVMLTHTPASFVFLYSKEGVTVIPAIAVLSSTTRSLYDHYSRSLSRFFEEHFSSFIGDRRISSVSDELLAELNARTGLLIEVGLGQGTPG